MTTIAIDKTMIAADSRTARGDELRANMVKIRPVHGRLYALSGALAVFDAIIAWHNAGAVPADAPNKSESDNRWILAVIGPDADLKTYSCVCPYPEPIDLPWTVGSGREYAQALLDIGMTPIEAIAAAARRDLHTGGPVVAYDLRTMLPIDTTAHMNKSGKGRLVPESASVPRLC